MALPPLTPRLVLAGCTGLLLLGGIAGAATVTGGSDEPARAPQVVASDSTVPPVPGGPSAPETVPGGIGAGSATTATTAGAATTTIAAPRGMARTTTTAARRGGSGAPGPLVAPRPGAYAYEATSTSAASGSRTDRITTTVESVGTEGAATIQAVTIPLDLAGQRADARNTVAWSAAGGAVVRRSEVSAAALGQEKLDCVWQPAFAQYAGGLAVGKTWSFGTRCAGRVQGFDVVLEQRATRRVTGTASVAGPAGPVATWTIADDTTVVVRTPLGATSVRSVGTQQLAPSLGLPVRTESRIETQMGTAPPQQGTATTRLVALP